MDEQKLKQKLTRESERDMNGTQARAYKKNVIHSVHVL